MNYRLLTISFAIIFIASNLHAICKDKIGLYDSRIIAVWYLQGGDGEYKTKMNDLKEAFVKAKINKDTTEMKKLEEIGQLLQKIAHDKGFGKGSVAEILENHKKEIEELAKNQKLIAVVSKWELNYSSLDIETIDITVELLKYLGANDNIIKMYDNFKNNPPIKDAFFIND